MSFVSFQYFAFIAVLFCGYFWLPRRGQNVLLLCASLWFIASWDYRGLLVWAFGTVVDFGLCRWLTWERPNAVRQRALSASVTFNLGLLVAFRYWSFLTTRLLAWTPVITAKPLLLVGLSFYTLQRLTHALDAYYRFIEPATSLLDYALFVAFFPQLVSGPIERARRSLPQLAVRRAFDTRRFHEGCWLLALGLFKKVYLADHFALAAKDFFVPDATSGDTLLGIYLYALRLYADFAGYSDMARGTARLFGLDVMQNFHAPYFATSLADYWKRWHISLSSFLEDYVHNPVAMALRNLGSAGVIAALWVTFTLSGLWHGNGLTFVIWGAIHAAGLTVYALTRKARKRLKKRVPAPLMTALSALVTFHYVCFGYVFFRAGSVASAWTTLTRLATVPTLSGKITSWAAELFVYSATLLALDLIQQRTRDDFWILSRPTWLRALCYGTLLFCLLRFPAPTEDFIYAEF